MWYFFQSSPFPRNFFRPMDVHVDGRAADRFHTRASRVEGHRLVDERDDGDREHSGDARPRLDCGSQSRYESRREKLHFLLARINGEPRVISFKQTATIRSSVFHQPRGPFARKLPFCNTLVRRPRCVYFCLYMMDALIMVNNPGAHYFRGYSKATVRNEKANEPRRTRPDLKSLILFGIIYLHDVPSFLVLRT